MILAISTLAVAVVGILGLGFTWALARAAGRTVDGELVGVETGRCSGARAPHGRESPHDGPNQHGVAQRAEAMGASVLPGVPAPHSVI